jgi:hypothetical protein
MLGELKFKFGLYITYELGIHGLNSFQKVPICMNNVYFMCQIFVLLIHINVG